MIHRTQDGGQAFPHGGNESEDAKLGMTLRDWFAGQALSGVFRSFDGWGASDIAELSYEIADAMIEARK